MESAKNAVKGILSHHGKHETEVTQTTAPAVTNETITRTNEHRATTAVDKEIHQDHYHTTVQPVLDQATKSEQHHHKIANTQERHIEHDNADEIKRKLAAEQAQFKDTSRIVDGGSTTTEAPTVVGEHVHHHVHENVQPVIQREIIEPHITHTTIPVHEVHHNVTQHHAASELPAITRAEFEKIGAKEQHNTFAGEPKLAGNMGDAQNRRV